jgi:hypothetical protein
MTVGSADDFKDVRLTGLQHLVRIFKSLADFKLLLECGEALRIFVACRHDLDAIDFLPGRNLVVSPESAPGYSDPSFVHTRIPSG